MPTETPRISVAVLTALYPPAYLGGGPIRTIAALVASAPSWSKTYVVTSNRDLLQTEPLDVVSDVWQSVGQADVYFASVSGIAKYARAMLELRSRRPDVVYLNSFLNMQFSILPQVLAKAGFFGSATIVMAPRGELGSSALSLKSWKKRAFVAVYKAARMHRKVIWQASSDREARDIRRSIPRADSVIIHEDDVDLPSQVPQISSTPDAGRLRAVNIGRLVPIKGVSTLLEALARVEQPIVLDIYGPNEDPVYAAQCRELAGRVAPAVEVNFVGELLHAQVRDVLAGYDLMLFPTEGENFGHVVAEALSVGCPVMCNDTTPWTQRLREGGGVIVESSGVGAWASAVGLYASQDREWLFSRRQDAALAYERWRAEGEIRPHLFEVLLHKLPGARDERHRPSWRG